MKLRVSNYCRAIELALMQGYTADPKTGIIVGKSGKVLSVKKYGTQAYPTVRLHIKGLPLAAYSVRVHKVIGFLIWGHRAFQKGLHVRHRDGNVLNNTKKNLRLGTAAENESDKPTYVRSRVGQLARAAQGLPGNTLLTMRAALRIRVELKKQTGASGRVRRGVVKKLAHQYRVSASTISLIGKNKTWRE